MPKVRKKAGRSWVAFLAVLAPLSCAVAAQMAMEPGTGANWMSHRGGYDEGSFSRLREINPENIKRLGLAWSLDLPGEQSLEATPLAVDGVLYFTGSSSVAYAVDAASGKLLWSYDPEVWKQNAARMKALFAVNRGMAYADGRVFFGTRDGRLIALDAKSGRLLWSAASLDNDMAASQSGAPRVFKGKVLIGNTGGDWGVRGYVTAFDAATGARLWRFYTVPGDPAKDGDDPAMKMAAKTWSPGHWKVSGGGGTVWNGMTFDPELNRIYIGVGNGGPYDPDVRSPGGGDNLFLASIVALDADTGKYVWHYQVNPREGWDYKATADMVTATLNIDGMPRKVLMQAPTNGFFYVIDRTNGKLISAEKIGKVTWASHIDLKTGRPVEAPNIRYEKGVVDMWPGMLGGHNWQAMAFSPQTGLAYIPYQQMGQRWTRESPNGPVTFSIIGPDPADPRDHKGQLIAWDPIAQRARWTVQHPDLLNGGAMATAGGLVFQGTAEGKIFAYDAGSGKTLWTFDAGLGIIASPMSYQVGGHQYVAILVGYGGGSPLKNVKAGWKFGVQPRRLLAFRIDGKKRLAKSPPQDFTIEAADDPAVVIDPAQARSGAALYAQHCSLCHGIGLESAGAAPDLRESRTALDPDSFRMVVREGVLMPLGMPRFDTMNDKDLREMYMYIRAGARAALRGEAVAPVAGSRN